MDKFKLNMEIVRCRPLIRRAKVCTIRKKIKKIQVLKSCKQKEVLEKKLKKADRLVQDVMTLKTVKEDDVTKFALQNPNPDEIVSNPSTSQLHRLYATLAGKKEVKEKIDSIRNAVPDDQTSLQELLKTLGTRSLLKKHKALNKGISSKPANKRKKVHKETRKQTTSKKHRSWVVSNAHDDSSDDTDEADGQIKNHKRDKSMYKVIEGNKEEYTEFQSFLPTKDAPRKSDIKNKHVKAAIEKEIKVDDPFFVSKKVAVPKLLLEESIQEKKPVQFSREDQDRPRDKHFHFTDRRSERSGGRKEFTRFQPKTGKSKDRSWQRPKSDDNNYVAAPKIRESAEKLHPSWAAKRQTQIVRPFQGTKIKFDLD